MEHRRGFLLVKSMRIHFDPEDDILGMNREKIYLGKGKPETADVLTSQCLYIRDSYFLIDFTYSNRVILIQKDT